MKFMNVVSKYGSKAEYVNERKVMLDAAEKLLNEGKTEEAKAQMKDVEEFDGDYEDYAAVQANLKAMQAPSMANIVSITGGKIPESLGALGAEDMYNSLEYRNAFMENVLHGKAIPAKFQNADASTKTTDVGSVIPTTTMEKIIEQLTTVGNIISKVTRTFYKGGVAIPTSATKPIASWVVESAGSDKQKKSTGKITFTYYKLRCAISMSIETATVSLPVFEQVFIQNVVEAMTKAIEQSIFTGTGATGNQPKGFLTETVATNQNVDIAKTASVTYKDLCKAESVLPEEYEKDAEWYMRKSTFFNQIAAMVDTNGQPVARVNVGIDGKPSYNILGRPVNFTNYMAAYLDTVAADTIVACIFNMKDYVLNTNLDMTVKRYEDNDNDDQITKAIMLVDGKAVDINSLVTITKKLA